NDWHGHILPDKDYRTPGEPKPLMGGASRLASYLFKARNEAEKNGAGILLVDAGDIFHGTPEGNNYKGESIIEIMNALQYDAVAVGNHDFSYGPDNLKKLAAKARFPFLGANIIHAKSNQIPLYLGSYIIKEINGLKIGLIGVTTPQTKMMNFYENVSGLDFIKPAIAVSRSIAELQKNKADLIVVLSHLGYDDDKILAECLPQINVIVGGHDHLVLDPPEITGETIICQTGDNGLRVGKLDLIIDTQTKKIIAHENRIVNLYYELYHPDAQMEMLVEEYRDHEKDETIAYAQTTLPKDSHGEFALGDWVTDVMKFTAATDIALEPNGGIRCGLAKGPVTKRDLYCISPFDNTLVTFKLYGRQIHDLLEASLGDGDIQLQVSGLVLEYSPEKPKGSRITNLSIGGRKAQDGKIYTVAMNDFVVLGSKRYPQLKNLMEFKDTGLTIYQTLLNYSRQHSPIAKSEGGRIIKKPLELKLNKININTADEKTLMLLKGIGPKKAKDIIEYRKKSGQFTRIEDIMNVHGIGPGFFRKFKDNICVLEK
ncbi:MAG: 5'-nucleotidase C-terminal domain-containing protein, partial [bacterium]